MTDLTNKNPSRLVLFASSMVVIPVIQKLLQENVLAGVIVPAQTTPDSQFLLHNLQQAGIPFQQYDQSQPEQILPLIDHWQAELGLIYTFPHILPETILQAFRLGTYNLHASSLPKYRGSMPLYWQIRNRETNGNLSVVRAEAGIDSGDIMLQQALLIEPRDTLNTLATKMSAQAPALIMAFLEKLAKDELNPQPQEGEPGYAPMPKPEDLLVNWQTMNSHEIAALARAGNPQLNGAVLQWRQSQIALMQATPVKHPGYGVKPGTVLHCGEPEGLIVATTDGALRLDVMVVTEGVFSGLAFAERFGLDAGMPLQP